MSTAPDSNSPVFSGTYLVKVDKKRRIQIPADWVPKDRSETFTLLLWPLPGGSGVSIAAIPEAGWQALVNKLKSARDQSENDALRRMVGSNSECVEILAGRRMTIAERFLARAGITAEALLVGEMNRFSIWHPDQYEKSAALHKSPLSDLF